MKRITIVDEGGKSSNAFVSDEAAEIKADVAAEKKSNLKEHLYMGYLIVGTIAFTLGILISIKRLNGK
jgi:hypothetical protein